MNHALTLKELRRWEDHGATWRLLEVDEELVTVQLCTCYGEAVDLAQSREQEVIDYVRARLPSG